MKKILVERIPDRSWKYQEIIEWLFQIRSVWNINGIHCHKPEDVRAKLTKLEVLNFIEEQFEPQIVEKREYQIPLPKFDCYDIEYVGKGQIVAINTNDGRIHFAKGVSMTVYSVDCHLLDVIRKRDDFVITGRNYYNHEKQIIDTKKLMRTQRRDHNDSFFAIY